MTTDNKQSKMVQALEDQIREIVDHDNPTRVWLSGFNSGVNHCVEIVQQHEAEQAAQDAGVGEGLREKLRESISDALGDALDCMRVWSAWGVGTMSEDDFVEIRGDAARLEEIVDAAIFAFGEPRFKNVFCSQCGQDFGPGEHGFSHCRNHAALKQSLAQPAQVKQRIPDMSKEWCAEMAKLEEGVQDFSVGVPSQPSATVVPEDLRIKLRDAFAEVLGNAMDCTRVWSAWGVGTMTEDDFSSIAENEDRLEEFVSAALSVLLTEPQQNEMESFEKAFSDIYEPHEFSKNVMGGYENQSVHDAWVYYQECAASRSKP